MNYPVVDKQAYAVFKVVKQFRPYILKNRTKVIVPHPAVRCLTQKEDGGDEFLISFMSTGLQGDELNYPVVDKQVYTMFKVVKQLRTTQR